MMQIEIHEYLSTQHYFLAQLIAADEEGAPEREKEREMRISGAEITAFVIVHHSSQSVFDNQDGRRCLETQLRQQS